MFSKIFQGWKNPIWDWQQRRWLFFWKPPKRRGILNRRQRLYFWFRRLFVRLHLCKPLPPWIWHEMPAQVIINTAAIRKTK